jgi:hypothetical protein
MSLGGMKNNEGNHLENRPQHYIFHISSHYFLKEAKGFGGEGKRC